MISGREVLLDAYQQLIRVKGECSCELNKRCGISNFTLKQLEYLKIIDTHKRITFSWLARQTKTSKPTVSELITKFIQLDCVYKEKSPEDGRVSFICLTSKGKAIAQIEQAIAMKVVERIMESLSDQEVKTLIALFRKVK